MAINRSKKRTQLPRATSADDGKAVVYDASTKRAKWATLNNVGGGSGITESVVYFMNLFL